MSNKKWRTPTIAAGSVIGLNCPVRAAGLGWLPPETNGVGVPDGRGYCRPRFVAGDPYNEAPDVLALTSPTHWGRGVRLNLREGSQDIIIYVRA